MSTVRSHRHRTRSNSIQLLSGDVEADHACQVAHDQSAAGQGHGSPRVMTVLERLVAGQSLITINRRLGECNSSGVVHGQHQTVGDHVRSVAEPVRTTVPDFFAVQIHAHELPAAALPYAENVFLIEDRRLLFGVELLRCQFGRYFGS